MKIIKSFFLVTVGIFATTLLQAQELKTETFKPVKSTVPDPGSKPVLAPDSKPNPKIISNGQQPESEFKITETNNVPSSAVTDEEIKPQKLPLKNMADASLSTTDITFPNTVLPKPIMSNMTSTVTTTAPVIPTKKPIAAAQQQKQN